MRLSSQDSSRKPASKFAHLEKKKRKNPVSASGKKLPGIHQVQRGKQQRHA